MEAAKRYQIRRASGADFAALTELEAACFTEPWSETAIAAFFANPCARAFLAEADGKAVGLGFLYCMTGEAEIADLAVLQEYRALGIGTALLKQMLAATDADTERVFLEVRAGNDRAIRLYEKAGFVRYGIRKTYYSKPPEDAILMVCALTIAK